MLKQEAMQTKYEKEVIDNDHQYNLLQTALADKKEFSTKFNDAVNANSVLSDKLHSERANHKSELSSLKMKIDEEVRMHDKKSLLVVDAELRIESLEKEIVDLQYLLEASKRECQKSSNDQFKLNEELSKATEDELEKANRKQHDFDALKIQLQQAKDDARNQHDNTMIAYKNRLKNDYEKLKNCCSSLEHFANDLEFYTDYAE
eukprot:scaffold22307_cov92-Cyclotella_meneghiniana.AAC.1